MYCVIFLRNLLKADFISQLISDALYLLVHDVSVIDKLLIHVLIKCCSLTMGYTGTIGVKSCTPEEYDYYHYPKKDD